MVGGDRGGARCGSVWTCRVLGFSLPSTPSSGTSTIRTRASGRHTTGTMTTGATPGTHRGAQAHSSHVSWRPLPASSTSAHLSPPHPSLPGPVVLGDGSSQGCLPSEGLFPHTGPGISSGFKQATMTFYFLFVPLPSSSSLPPFWLKTPIPCLGRTVRLQGWGEGPFLSSPPSPALAPQLPRLSCSWL